jgi:hypothetical protein
MRRRRPSYDAINKELGGHLATVIRNRRAPLRGPAVTYTEIAHLLTDRTGQPVDKETVRRWWIQIQVEDQREES